MSTHATTFRHRRRRRGEGVLRVPRSHVSPPRAGYNGAVKTEQIGPYRIEEHLGSGGMGVVYKAYDERLDRHVAIKSIHPSKELSRTRRQRLLREARAAAGLSHAAIAQVYDIISEGDRDYIVMEYVQGVSLAALLVQGPMESTRVVDLGRQIAEGLVAAHAQGIIHRDLKAENIMVTPGGRIKILDFGLAKRYENGGDETSLTQDGVVMGTSRAMSPEQAKAENLDTRSDLFSFGSLLYEMATGTHPFQGASPLDTMQRIVRHNPPPPRKLNPEIPEELSLLIENLLEKNPARRPQSAAEVASTFQALEGLWTTRTTDGLYLSQITGYVNRRRRARRLRTALALGVPLLLLLAGFAWWQSRRPSPPKIVAVLAPAVEATGSEANGELPAGVVRATVLDTIAGLRGLATPSIREVDQAGDDIQAIARRTAASELIVSNLTLAGPTIQLTLQRLGSEGTKVLWSTSFTVPADDPALLADAVRAHVLQAYPDFEPRRKGRASPPPPGALAEYIRLRQQLTTLTPGVTTKHLFEEFDALRQANPRFLLPYLGEAQTGLYQYIVERDPSYRDRVREILARARELAPEDPRVAAAEAALELAAGDLDAATGAVHRLKKLAPGSPDAFRFAARLLMKQGKNDEAIALLQRMVNVYPSVTSLWELAEAELHTGRIDAARRHLSRGLELEPESRRLLGKLAQVELVNGDPREAERLHRKLVAEEADPLNYSNLGLACLLQGKIQQALEAYEQADRLAPRDPVTVMSIADCRQLLGDTAAARNGYETALELAESLATSDRVTYLGIRAQCLAHLGKAREAIQAVQDEIQLAPKEPMVYLDATLTYALIGDRTTAVVHAEKAVELGMNSRWLELPFFETLRGDPAFDALLTATPGPRGAG